MSRGVDRRRPWRVLRWLAPTALLVLAPKCPACIAAYVLAATGIGLSIPAASHLRLAFLAVGVAALAYVSVTAALRLRRARRAMP